MIIVLKKGATQQDIDKLTNLVTAHGVQVNPVIGTELTILGLVGDTSQVDPNRIESFPCVERVMHVAEPFKKANRMFHPEDTVVDVAGVPVGGKRLAVMAGPCSVESRGAGHGHCPGGEAGRGQHPPGRRLQAPHLPLRLPGPEVRGPGAPVRRPGGHRAAHRQRDHVPR